MLFVITLLCLRRQGASGRAYYALQRLRVKRRLGQQRRFTGLASAVTGVRADKAAGRRRHYAGMPAYFIAQQRRLPGRHVSRARLPDWPFSGFKSFQLPFQRILRRGFS